jgi:hypothetical protein
LTLSVLAWVTCGSCKSRSSAIQTDSPNEPGSSALLSPNDLAVLFHLPNVKTKVGTLQEQVNDWLISAEPDQGNSILPRGSIQNIISKFEWPSFKDTEAIKQSFLNQKSWYVTAFRLGCLWNPGPNDGHCRSTLRLVIQPIQWSDSIVSFQRDNNRGPIAVKPINIYMLPVDPIPFPDNEISTEDAAIHLIYDLPEDRVDELLLQIQLVQKQLSQKFGIDRLTFNLGVHPALDPLSSDATSRNFFLEQMQKLIRQFANYESLHSAELMVTSGVGDARQTPLPITWSFGTFRKDQKGELALSPIARGVVSRSKGKVPMKQELSFEFGYIPYLKDAALSFFEIVEFWRTKDAAKETASVRSLFAEPTKTKINEIAAHIDNPKNLNILMGDCVSCHISSTLRNLSMHFQSVRKMGPVKEPAERLAVYVQSMFSEYPSQVPKEIESLTQNNVPPVVPDYNLHQFSYFLHRPSISKRAANDIAYDTLYYSARLKDLLAK